MCGRPADQRWPVGFACAVRSTPHGGDGDVASLAAVAAAAAALSTSNATSLAAAAAAAVRAVCADGPSVRLTSPLPPPFATAGPLGEALMSEAAGMPLHSLADLLLHVLCFLRASSLSCLFSSSHELELRARLLLPAILDRRGWGEQDLCANPLSTLHLSELWDIVVHVTSLVGVHYMVLRNIIFGTMLELQLSGSTTLARFGFQASDEAPPMWCRGSFVVRAPLQCKGCAEELRRRPRRLPITQATLATQSSYRVEHCGDRFVLRPAGSTAEERPQLQLTRRGFIAIAAEGGGVIVEDGQPARRIKGTDPDQPC